MRKLFAISLFAFLLATSVGAQNDMFGRPLFGSDGTRISYIHNHDGSWTEKVEHVDGSVSFTPRPLDRTVVSEPGAQPKSHSDFEFGMWQVIREYDSSESALKFFVTPSGKRRVAAITDFYFDDAHDYHLFVYEHNSTTNSWDEVHAGGWQYSTNSDGDAITVADMNKDNEPDIIVGHRDGLTVFLATTGSSDYQMLRPEAEVGSVIAVLAFDVDHDTHLDIISLPWSTEIVVSYGEGNGMFRSHIRYGGRTHAGWDDMEIGDVDGDGQDELVVMSGQGWVPNFTIYELVPGLPFVSEHYVASRELTSGIAIADFNNDGRDDIELSKGDNSPTWLYEYRQNPGGTLPDTPDQITTYDIAESLETANVDCVDNLPDLVVAHGGWTSMGLYQQETPGLLIEQLFDVPYASHYDSDRGIDLGDGNGDGIIDLFVADYNNGFLFLPGQCTVLVPTDTDGDTVPDGEDCAPSDPNFYRAPRETSNLRVEWHFPPTRDAGVHISWNNEASYSGPGTTYEGISGNIAYLHEDRGFMRSLCVINVPSEPWFDDAEPGSHWYLSRAKSCGQKGAIGSSFMSPVDYEDYLDNPTTDPCP